MGEWVLHQSLYDLFFNIGMETVVSLIRGTVGKAFTIKLIDGNHCIICV